MALTGATVAELTQQRLRQLLDERPEVAQWMLRQLARRLRQANDVVADLVFSDVPARVAQILVNLAGEFGIESRRRRPGRARAAPAGARPAPLGRPASR